jgi:hypothetical protein
MEIPEFTKFWVAAALVFMSVLYVATLLHWI